MLDISNFRINEDILFYADENHYAVYKSDDYGYTLHVMTLDEDWEVQDRWYAADSVSEAVRMIEMLENGKEI